MLVFDPFVTRVMYGEAFLRKPVVPPVFRHSKIFSDDQTATALPPYRHDEHGPLPGDSSRGDRVVNVVARHPAEPPSHRRALPGEVQGSVGQML